MCKKIITFLIIVSLVFNSGIHQIISYADSVEKSQKDSKKISKYISKSINRVLQN